MTSSLDAFVPTRGHIACTAASLRTSNVLWLDTFIPTCQHTSQHATSTYLRVCMFHTYNLNILHPHTSNFQPHGSMPTSYTPARPQISIPQPLHTLMCSCSHILRKHTCR